MKLNDVIIIGAGPAGIAAAIQLKRYGIDSVLIEKNRIGGLLRNANLVENYPGFPDPVTGHELACLFEKHLDTYSNVIYDEVISIKYNDGIFNINTANKKYLARFIVIASGTKPVQFQDVKIPYTVKFKVYSEIFSILNSKDMEIIIVGAGDAAYDYALNLSRNNRVSILNRNAAPSCLPLLSERAVKHSNITIYNNSKIIKIEKYGNRIQITISQSDNVSQIESDYIITAIGREPELGFLNESMRSNLDYYQNNGLIHLIGDVKNKKYRQTAISTGDGIKTAMVIYDKLRRV